MDESESFELRVMERVAAHAPVSFEELQRLLNGHTWNQLFAAMDRLSRRGALMIRRVDCGTYLLSLGPPHETGTDSPRKVSSGSARSA